MATLFLIDGMSQIYRAYYAIKGLTNSTGLPTNAVYGFTVMLRKLIKDEEPDYLGVAMDLAGPTVRHEQFADYKATRPRMPEDLVQQLPLIDEVCEAFGVPLLSCEKYEADDVIGTLARQAEEQGLEVVIVTVDKDLLQLVGNRISVLDTRNMTRLDSDKVAEKWGVQPSQVVDLLSLIGDSSDNIPGAPGIGEKGASQLISEYGSLDNLLENRAQVSRKSYRKSLEENEELILRSRELIRICDHLPLELDLNSLRLEEPDYPKMHSLLRRLEFGKLLEEFTPEQSKEAGLKILKVESPSGLEKLANRLQQETLGIAFWSQGSGPARSSFQGLALASGRNEAWFISGDLLGKASDEVSKVVAAGSEWFVHDLKNFLFAANNGGWRLSGQGWDTMLMAYLLSPNKTDFSLSRVGMEYLGYRITDVETGDTPLLPEASPEGLCRKASAVLSLGQKLRPKVRKAGLEELLTEVELPLVGVLADMERIGVKVDVDLLAKMSTEITGEIDRLSEIIFTLAGEQFNLNSPRQLSQILFERLNLPAPGKKGKAGHYSTGVEVLEDLSVTHEIAAYILEYRELAKLKSTYLDALPKLVDKLTGRIHTSYNQVVASTGRLSSSNPNLQNIPIRTELGRKTRQAFVPEPGFQLLSADYSQIELRVMAHLSGDPVLTDAFKKGQDIHERTAMEVFGPGCGMSNQDMRRRAKVINFGILYGLSAYGLARSLKISRDEAQRFINGYFEKYQGVQKWIDQVVEDARNDGHVTTLFGRIRQIPELASKNWNLREFGKRTAVNAPIQGTAADLIKIAMVSIHRKLQEEGFASRIILQVHDELVVEVENSEVEAIKTLVRDEMENVFKLDVPLKVDLSVGNTWFDAK